jgi:hypothetical protein
VQGRAWREEIPQASLVPLAFPLFQVVKLCMRRLEGSAVRVCVTELLDCRERLQREGETDQTEGPSVVDQAKETGAPTVDTVKDQIARTFEDSLFRRIFGISSDHKSSGVGECGLAWLGDHGNG